MLETGERILYLFLGWLLALLNPVIVDSIKKRRELKETKKVLFVELQEVLFRLTIVVYLIAEHTGKRDRELLEWMRPVVESYKGINRSDRILENVKKLLAEKDETLDFTAKITAKDEQQGLSFKKFVVPLLDSKIGQLGAFDREAQNFLLEIRAKLNLINEDIDQYRIYFNQTFNSNLSDGNHTIIRDNIQGLYKSISQQARLTANLIQRVLKRQ